MKIKIFMSSAANDQERDILKLFGKGIQQWLNQCTDVNQKTLDVVRVGRWESLGRFDHTLEYEYAESYSACDLAVIFGSWKPREKGTHQTRTSVATQAKKFLVIETPLFNRLTSKDNTSWRVGINGFLNRDAQWPVLPAAEADQQLQDMGVSWNGWHNDPEGHIVVVLQLPGDASLRGADINDWALRTVNKLRSVSDRPIVIRNHPLCSQRAFGDHEELGRRLLLQGHNNLRFSDGQIIPWQQDLEGAYCTVTYTSGLAIDSVLSGIPTVACDPGNFTWGISENDPVNVEKICLTNRDIMQNWLRSLSACQWSEQQMKSGHAWRVILKTLEKS